MKCVENNRISEYACSSINQVCTPNVDTESLDDQLEDNFLLQHLCSEIMEEVMDSGGDCDNCLQTTLDSRDSPSNSKKKGKKGKNKKKKN